MAKITELDPNFKHEVTEYPGGENIKLCFDCGSCTALCPVSDVDEQFNPRKIIRMTLLGMQNELLASEMLWLCLGCFACTARCPHNVKFAEITSVLREIAVKKGYVDRSFLEKTEKIDQFIQKTRLVLIHQLWQDKDKPLDFAKLSFQLNESFNKFYQEFTEQETKE